MNYLIKAVSLLVAAQLLISIAGASVPKSRWMEVNESNVDAKFDALMTTDGDVVTKNELIGYEETVAQIMEEGRVETRKGVVIYAMEIGNVSIPTMEVGKKNKKFGKNPASEQ